MRTAWACSIFVFIVVLSSFQMMKAAGNHEELSPQFHTSDRCLACHNGLITSSGQDISIGIDWRSSVMANSARDPYWQASVRRETIDHAESNAAIQDECTVCHMPITRYLAKQQGKEGQAFAYLPFNAHPKGSAYAEDGVTCSVCHQITKEKLGTRASFNGGFSVLAPPSKNDHPEYGPFDVSGPHQHIMETSTQGFVPTFARHIRDAALCGTCHQLYTTARGAGGKDIGYLPEQMPYLEWLHSDFPNKYTCQECHMPEVHGAAPITAVLPVERNGVHQHVFVGGNFFLQRMLNLYRNDLNVAALPQELTNASNGTIAFLQSQAARVSFRNIAVTGGKLQAEVLVENLTGHKLPTAFPSRRAWLHFLVKDRNGRVAFESGALNPDGSITGNDNDSDAEHYEPHYREITSSDQVEIYEDILSDSAGHVTTGLIAATGYLKDNRLLPTGFDKATAEKDIRVIGDAADDPAFTAGGDVVRYSVPLTDAQGPLHIEVELLYQPIGFRWAHNLAPYKAEETQRFVKYYESMSTTTAVTLARAEATR